MEVVPNNTLLPGDPRLIEHIVCELKSQGIFDQFRKECIDDVDTKPAYQNLRQRVEGSVTGFLKTQSWRPDMNKNQLREMLRKNIYESGFLETGVERIVDQVVYPKINSVFLPQVEDVVYNFLGMEKPIRNISTINGPLTINTIDLLPTDLDPISPDSEVMDKSLNKSDKSNDDTDKLDDSKNDEFESPPFEPITEQSVFSAHEDSSNDSHLSGISGLTSHDSNSQDAKLNIFSLDVANQDSQLSKVSSNSRLSIITSDSKHDSEKMDISDDTQSLKSAKLDEESNLNVEELTEKSENATSHFRIKPEVSDEIDAMRLEINEHQNGAEEMKNECGDVEMDIDEDSQDVKTAEEVKTFEDESIAEETNKESLEKEMEELKMNVQGSDDSDKFKLEKEFCEETKALVSLEETSSKETEENGFKSGLEDQKTEDSRDSLSKCDAKVDDSSEKDADLKKQDSSEEEVKKSEPKSEKSERPRHDSDRKHSSRSESKDKKDDRKADKDRKEKERNRSSSSSKDKDKYKEKSKEINRAKDSSKSKDDKRPKEEREASKSSSKDEKSRSSSSSKYGRDRSSSKSDSKSSKDSKDRTDNRSKPSTSSKTKDDKPKSDETKASKSDDAKKSDASKKTEDAKKESSDLRKSSKSEETKSSSSKSDESKSSSASSRSRSDSTKHASSSSSADRKSSSSKDHKDRKEPKKSSKRDKDDHSSSRDKKTDNRRSADRDSNDGSSGVGNNSNSNSSKDKESSSVKSSENSNDSSQGSNSGDSGQSDNSQTSQCLNQNEDSASIKAPVKILTETHKYEVRISPAKAPDSDSDTMQHVKIRKPKFASNIFEARRLMKVRKKLEKLEKRRQRQLLQGTKHRDVDSASLEDTDSVDSGCLHIVDQAESKDASELENTRAEHLSTRDESTTSTPTTSVVSKESWDALEAKLSLNVDYDSYIDENCDSSSSSKHARRSSDEEDCLYFVPQISPKTERYLKKMASLQRDGARLAIVLEDCRKMAPPHMKHTEVPAKRARKTNQKYMVDEGESKEPATHKKTTVADAKNSATAKKKAKGKKRKFEMDGFYSDNNNKKSNNHFEVTDMSEDYEEVMEPSPSASNTSNGSIELTTKIKPPVRSKKTKKTNSVQNETFPLPLSPESDVSASSVEVRNVGQDVTAPVKTPRASVKKSQRYSSDDLYKPRPFVSGSSRRQRGLLNSTDKVDPSAKLRR